MTDTLPPTLPPSRDRTVFPNYVRCELAHDLTVRECLFRGVTLDAYDSSDDPDELHYSDEAQRIFDAIYDVISEVLEPYCEKGGAQ
jgi:hypothetical protein